MKKKNLLIGGGILAVGLVLYMYNKNKKPAVMPNRESDMRDLGVRNKLTEVTMEDGKTLLQYSPSADVSPTKGGSKSGLTRFA